MAKDISQQIHEAIDAAVKEATGKIFDAAIEQAKKDAEAERDKIIAKAAMSISRWYNFQDLGQTLRIEVRKPE